VRLAPRAAVMKPDLPVPHGMDEPFALEVGDDALRPGEEPASTPQRRAKVAHHIPAEGRRVSADVVVVPVLRAGLGMLDAILELMPAARVGHIGLQRDESTAIASQYYSKLPKGLSSSVVLMIDPMLATGGSAVAALDHLAQAGARDIRMICIVAAPEGVDVVQKHHPGVRIYTPAIDKHLNEHKYIVPGLGDFGDRLYGTL